MSLILLYAFSVIGAFIGWYACGPIRSTAIRSLVRASLIAFLCAPGLLIGHGVGIAPTLFALAVQPSIFTFGSIGIIWLPVLALIFAIPALRGQKNRWPPSAREFFVNGYVGKYLLYGLVYAMLLVSALYADDRSTFAIQGITYALFFSGSVINFALSFYAIRLNHANPYLTPVLFAAPVFFGAAPPVSLLWFGGGAAGAMVACRRHRIAAWISAAVSGALAANFLQRSYRAIDAPSHVSIEGGVAGNAAIAALFVVLAIACWWRLNRANDKA
jgi:hypothetical protein